MLVVEGNHQSTGLCPTGPILKFRDLRKRIRMGCRNGDQQHRDQEQSGTHAGCANVVRAAPAGACILDGGEKLDAPLNDRLLQIDGVFGELVKQAWNDFYLPSTKVVMFYKNLHRPPN